MTIGREDWRARAVRDEGNRCAYAQGGRGVDQGGMDVSASHQKCMYVGSSCVDEACWSEGAVGFTVEGYGVYIDYLKGV
jgi:hypothetical protein